MMRLLTAFLLLASAVYAEADEDVPPLLPIDPVWKTEAFRKAMTGSYGIDSRIEPRITVDEEHYLDKAAEAMAEGDREAAIRELQEAELTDRSPAIAFQLGSLFFEEGKMDEAGTAFTSALEQFPNFRDAHRNLAILLVQENQMDDALPHLVRAVELGSREGITMGLLGYCHASRGNHRAALDAYRLAALTQPGEAQWKNGQAQALAQLNRQDDAIAIYEELLEADSANDNLWLLQADSLIALDRDRSAAANLELVHRMGSLSPGATLSLGHLLLQSDLPRLALERYEAAVTSPEPVAFSKAVEAVELLLSSREIEAAATLAGIVETQYPDPPSEPLGRLTRARAIIELETGDASAGAERLEGWLANHPTDGEGLILLARFREGEGKREEAEMLLEQAAVFPEHAPAAWEAHGKLLVNFGEYEAAIEKLKKALEQKPDEALASYLEAVAELVD